jgi:DNA polymerase-4
MVMTSNYEARKFGIRAGMAMWVAKKACPGLISFEPSKYKYE